MSDSPPLVKIENETLYRQASSKTVLWIGLTQVILFITGVALATLGAIHLLELLENTHSTNALWYLFSGISFLIVSVKIIDWLFVENYGILWVKVNDKEIPALRQSNQGQAT